MKTGTILLLLLIVAIAAACAKTIPDTQEIGGAEATTAIDNALTIDDQILEGELTADPLEDIGTLDDVPVDDSIPE